MNNTTYSATVKRPCVVLRDVVRHITAGGEYHRQASLLAGFPVFTGESEKLTTYAACNAVSVDDGESYKGFIYASSKIISICGGVINGKHAAVLLHEAGHLLNGDPDRPTTSVKDYLEREVLADHNAVKLGHGAEMCEVLKTLANVSGSSPTLDHRIMVLEHKLATELSMSSFDIPEFSLCSLVGRKVISLGGRKFLDPVKNDVFTQESGMTVVIKQLPTAVWSGTHRYYYSQKLDKIFGVRGEVHMKKGDPRRELAIQTWNAISKG